jgi:hypothetical protein
MNSTVWTDFDNAYNKYQFYYDTNNRRVICTTTYKGSIIRATATCNPDDSFELETGKKLAYIRCKNKFLSKKAAHAAKVYAKNYADMVRTNARLSRTANFVKDVADELAEAQSVLADFEVNLTK